MKNVPQSRTAMSCSYFLGTSFTICSPIRIREQFIYFKLSIFRSIAQISVSSRSQRESLALPFFARRSNLIDNVAVYRDGVTRNTYFLFASELPSLHLPCTKNRDPRSAFSKIETFWRILWQSDRTSSSLQMSFTCENIKRVIVWERVFSFCFSSNRFSERRAQWTIETSITSIYTIPYQFKN